MRFSVVLAALTLAGLSQPRDALAWGYDGHRAVCAMAWDGLRPATRHKVAKIIGKSVPGKTGRAAFAESCLWADTLGLTRPELRPEHYINVPRDALGIDLTRDCPADKKCVVRAITAWEEVLRSTPDRDIRRDALRFVAHYIGDVHQPLHTGYADDLGGNAMKGQFMGKDANMHGLWDYGMLDAMAEKWPQMVRRLEREITRSNRRSWSFTGPLEWAEESFIGARAPQAAYRLESRAFAFDRSYADANLPTVYERLKMAGARLTITLERALKKL